MKISSLNDILQIQDVETLLSDEVFEYLVVTDYSNLEKNAQIIRNYIKQNKKTLDCLRVFNALLKERKQKLQDKKISTYILKIPESDLEIEIKTRNYYIDEENNQIVKKVTKNGSDIPICESIIVPYSIVSDIKTDTKMVDIAYLDTDFKWKTKRVSASALTVTSALTRQIGEVFMGINSNNTSEMLRFFQEVVSHNSKLFIPKKSVSYFGWKNEIYEKSDIFIPFAEDCEYIGNDSEGKQIYDSIIKSAGNIEDWVNFTQKARNHLPTRLAMAASFASPLLQLLDTDPFSVLLHGGSGLGKSHSNYIAMSIWGKSKIGEGLTFSIEATKNYLPRLLSTLKNIPGCFDELALYEGDLNLLLYLISQGQEKGRMTVDKELGDVVSKKRRKWRNTVLLSGEYPIISENSDAGALNRVIQICVEDKIPIDFDEIRDFISQNYGIAGRLFIEHISKLEPKDLKKRLKEIRNEILDKVDTTDKQALIMGILLLADEVANKLFYTDEKMLTVEEISKYLYLKEEISYGIRAYKAFMSAIMERQANFYRTKDGICIGEKPKVFWGEIIDGTCVKILKTSFTKMLKDLGLKPEQAISEWKVNNMLILTKTRKLTSHQTTVRSNPGNYIIVDWIDKYIKDENEQEENNNILGKVIPINKNGNYYVDPLLKPKVKNGEQLTHEDYTKAANKNSDEKFDKF